MDITIKNLRKSYNDKLILEIPEMHFEKQKIIGIYGENGVGKSTLLRILAGAESYEGQILMDGELADYSKDYRIGLIQQKPYLFKRSVYENLEYPLKIRKVPKSERHEKVLSFLTAFQLLELSHQRADTLSGGESQKVALARMLLTKPRLLLLDETMAHLHEETMLFMEAQLNQYYEQEKCTILLVTHNQAQAKRFCHTGITI